MSSDTYPLCFNIILCEARNLYKITLVHVLCDSFFNLSSSFIHLKLHSTHLKNLICEKKP